MVTILVVEDDDMVRMLTKARLSPLYDILEAASGEEALAVLERRHVDLLIVDVMMPGMGGYALVQELRQARDMTPVILLTAMDGLAHKREGFASGADDYMTKPICYEELLWRIEAILRRARIANERRIQIGRFSLERDACAARYDGRDIPLTAREFDLLYKLLSYPGQVFTRRQLMDEIWGYDYEPEYDAVKTYISRLRNKFSGCGAFEIAAIRGLGYKAVIHEAGEDK